MNRGVPKKIHMGETRAAVTPGLVPLLRGGQHIVLVEAGAGAGAHFSDSQYLEAGAQLCASAAAIYEQADLLVKVQLPRVHPLTGLSEAEMVRPGAAYLGFLSPHTHQDGIAAFARRKVTAFAMDLAPRIMSATNAISGISRRISRGGRQRSEYDRHGAWDRGGHCRHHQCCRWLAHH